MRRVRKKIRRRIRIAAVVCVAVGAFIGMHRLPKCDSMALAAKMEADVDLKPEILCEEIPVLGAGRVCYEYLESDGCDYVPEKKTGIYEILEGLTVYDEEVLMQIAMAEAEGESIEGKALVMLVVLNRCLSDEFPGTVPEVVCQEGQFTPVENGRYDKVTADEECEDALEMVLRGWDESRGALYFASTDFPHSWHERNCEYLFTEGKHDFYR